MTTATCSEQQTRDCQNLHYAYPQTFTGAAVSIPGGTCACEMVAWR